MTPQELALIITAVAGAVLSLLFKYVPPLSEWLYDPKLDKWRGTIMLGFNALIVAALFGLTCTGLYVTVACNTLGVKDLLIAFYFTVSGNQLAYLATPPSPAKLEQDREATH